MKWLAIILTAVFLSACASSKSGNVYSREQTKREMTVRKGVIESVRVVAMEGTKSGIGTIAGSVVGGVAGSGLGGGKGKIIGAVLGAVAGGLAGGAIEENTTQKPALELTVRLAGDRSIVVIQEGEAGEFQVGDTVRVLSDRGETRITR